MNRNRTFNRGRCFGLSKTRRNDRPLGSPRRGGFSIVVLVCLLISTMILASLLKIMWLHNRQSGRELLRVQSQWLADSGLERAASRLAVDRQFSAETWAIDAAQLGGRDGAVVSIQIENVEAQPLQRLVVVEAVYPANGPDQARVTRQATVTLRGEE